MLTVTLSHRDERVTIDYDRSFQNFHVRSSSNKSHEIWGNSKLQMMRGHSSRRYRCVSGVAVAREGEYPFMIGAVWNLNALIVCEIDGTE